jgi:glycosyltransferase involved in cell wall biosynthesis
VLLLGRISPEKGFHLAIDAARRASMAVVLAGRVFPYRSHCEYFDYVIAPRLGDDVRYVGPVDAVVKRRLLATVSCVAIPSIVPETSSLTAMEALASGTPVVALKSPALEELIEDGKTGFLVRDVDEMALAFARVPSLARSECRRAAERRCALSRMTSEYLAVYRQLVGRRQMLGPIAGTSGTRIAAPSQHEREPESGPHDQAAG